MFVKVKPGVINTEYKYLSNHKDNEKKVMARGIFLLYYELWGNPTESKDSFFVLFNQHFYFYNLFH